MTFARAFWRKLRCGPKEEIALPIRGKKNKLDSEIFIDYFGRVRLGLNPKIISSTLTDLKEVAAAWEKLIEVSFLPEKMKREYRLLLENRRERLLKQHFFETPIHQNVIK